MAEITEYKITVIDKRTGDIDRVETWTWFGGREKGNKILNNFTLYASDVTLLMTDENEIVDGYSYVFNNRNELVVSAVKGSEAQVKPSSNFNYVNITSKGCEGWLNLFLGDFCIAMVSDNTVANMIRAEVKEK